MSPAETSRPGFRGTPASSPRARIDHVVHERAQPGVVDGFLTVEGRDDRHDHSRQFLARRPHPGILARVYRKVRQRAAKAPSLLKISRSRRIHQLPRDAQRDQEGRQ